MRESLDDLEFRLWEIIHLRHGPQRAIPQKEIARLLGVSVREVRLITWELNKKGYAAATTVRPPYGIYRMMEEEHKDAYLAQLRSRAFRNLERAGFVEAIDLGDGHIKQLEMFR